MRLFQRLLDLGCAAALGLIGFWAFSRHITQHANTWKPEDAIFRFDPFGLYYPMLDYAAASFRDGRLPLWNPFQFAGQPFLASFYPGTLYPLNAPYLFLPVDKAMWVTTVLHVLLAGWLVALYARRAHGAVRIDTPLAGRSLVILTLGGVLGILLAAPQLIPTLEISRFSVRSTEGLTLSQIEPWGPIPWRETNWH